MIKAKLIAAGLHAVISVFIAALVALLVFGLWFPDGISDFTKGTKLFFLVLGVELCLGPLMSLVIYSTKKPKAELLRDYAIIAIIQVSALFYGVYTVAQSRPVYFVLVKDQINVVAAIDLDTKDLQEAAPPFNRLTWFGPKKVCADIPIDPQKKSDLLMSALGGKDIHLLPSYYRACTSEDFINAAYDSAQALARKNVDESVIADKLQGKDYKWLPAIGRFGFWIVAYPLDNKGSIVHVDEDPYL